MPLPSNTVTRFPNGINTSSDSSLFANLPVPTGLNLHAFATDFDTFTAAEWVVTETQAGATQALTAGDGGWLALVNSAANNDLNAIQKTPAAFSFTAGKQAWFNTRLKVDDATNAAFVVGMQVVDTTPLDVTDGIYFLKAAAGTSVSFICRKDATTGSTSIASIGTMANDTFATMSWYYDGIATVYCSFNGVVVGSLAATSAYLPDTITTVSFAIQNSTAVARTMTVDRIGAWFER